MKKSFVVTALLAAVLLTACEKVSDSVPADGTVNPSNTVSDTVSEAKQEASAADVTAAVMAEIEIASAVEKTADSVGAFYDIDTAAVTDMSVFVCGSGAYPDELAAFKFKDGDSAKSGAEAVKKRLESQTALYTDYTPDEVYKLEGANLIEKDNWVILTICSDNDRAKEIINGLI